MRTEDVTLRPAVESDAEFIALTVIKAVDIKDNQDSSIQYNDIKKCLTECAEMKNTLYSYENTIIAEAEGKRVGAIISYPGKMYLGYRVNTFCKLYHDTGIDLSANPMETNEEEYYLDSLMVLPEYRGFGIGGLLVEKACESVSKYDYKRLALIARADDHWLKYFYFNLGFRETTDLRIFDHEYIRFIKFPER
jgi:ribosomal protein S18 acetylase RimI-like enzyme